ncbi:Lon protease family protein [Candidatus Nitrotoga sp. M5]|uniref:Lon protease family protein n=1 Tax=Candidatus Nitrotoga sp. M5 TaxID=2890409 RepID=UPI001EF2B0A5|nr:ATP-binding protein [Candidatus Nitrotoga sp. M5]CAH1386314.1 ATP-dependent protease La Type II [Candidatus Nitrotoga sp. M5]
MLISNLSPADLRFTIDPDSLGFSDTSELLQYPLSWIGQERAEMAARFGLGMNQPDYNLFVLGEVGSGRSSLLRQAMQAAAANKAVPPDLCYLHNFDVPEKPQALYLPAGQGRLLRQLMLRMVKSLQTEIPQCLVGQDFKAESERIEKTYKEEESKSYAELEAFAEARKFAIQREDGRMVFTLLGKKKHLLTEDEVLVLPKEHRAEIEQAEQELREKIASYFEKTRPLERVMNDALAALLRQVVKPLLNHELQGIRDGLNKEIKDHVKFSAYLEQIMQDVLENLELFKVSNNDEESRQEALRKVLSRYRVNLIVDNGGLSGAPIIVEDNPLFRSLFGSIECQTENDMLVTDFTRIRAGSLHKAHGGFLMLQLRDLQTDEVVWAKLRRLLRSGKLQMEEPSTALTPIAAISLEPEAVNVNVKIILIGSREEYYELQEGDPEFARRFRVKVDFAENFIASADTRRASSIFIAHTCLELGLPHFSAAAVARLLEDSHRETDDQFRQSAIFSRVEALVMESAALCRARSALIVEAADVEDALRARISRHDYPDQRLHESIAEGDVLITVHGEKVGQINGLSQIDLGDYRFGFPLRITARTFAGEDGLLNIGREVEMSGPIHDKGVFILQNYVSALFFHLAPLALNASIVFEQDYYGVEGDSASCAELYVLLSSLSNLPLKQGIAVTGAVDQHGEVLPVGGINEKIEGYFRVCETAGLDGSQGVLIPHRNRRHLMLEHKVIEAVAKGLFHIYTAEHASEGIELLTGFPIGIANGTGNYPYDSVLGRAQKTLLAYRRACQMLDHPKEGRRHLR